MAADRPVLDRCDAPRQSGGRAVRDDRRRDRYNHGRKRPHPAHRRGAHLSCFHLTTMARSKTTTSTRKLTAETLVALGPESLARLILTQAEADPLFARAVRMAMAAKEDVSSLAHEIDKRLKTIRRSTRFLDWDKVRPLARELDQLRESIVGPLAEQSTKLAIEQMRLFLSLAESVYERADDSNGSLGDVFCQGGEDLGALWVRAG